MSLKELLGEELYSQVIEKAGDNKIAIVSDGNWIPKEKFDVKNQEVKDLQEQLNNRDEQLEELKKVDAEGLQAKIDELQQQNEATKAEYEEKLQQQAFEHKLHDVLKDSGVRNVKAVKALLDIDEIKLDGDKLLGLDGQLEKLKETDDYLFQSDEPKDNGPTIVNPGNPQGGGTNQEDDPFVAKLAKYK